MTFNSWYGIKPKPNLCLNFCANSDFPFYLIDRRNKAKETNMPYYLLSAEGRRDSYLFQIIRAKVIRKQPHLGFEIRSLIPFPMTVTIVTNAS